MKDTRLYLTGGLGNQLFQLKFACELENSGLQVTLDTSMLKPRTLELPTDLGKFKIVNKKYAKPRFVHYLAHRNLLPTVIFENQPNNIHKFLTHLVRLNHFGYYQSQMKDLTFPIPLGNYEETLMKKFEFAMELSNSIAIHIRGGDFKNSKIYINLDENYYIRVLKSINLTRFHSIFIFTDDFDYAQELLDSIQRDYSLEKFQIHFVNQDLSPLETLKLFSIANTRIISNSTFSWWGAILALNRDRINTYTPSTFFHERPMNIPLPTEWRVQDV